ncbi:uncharacterized protein LOC123011392 [Tribolium madens]|uniref:uncharacterized protein LOC123011392 n=1 Tax=Tribolium madens TaxID=41895 RepID=UPI001CF75BAB|nr:uncharacterized protein LOC123011392 [Tribolium madens]
MPSITHLLLISVLISENLCNNMTGKYHTMDTQSKTYKLLTFNTEQNGDISMELAFNVPFITIPVKKSVDMAKGAIANLNVGAVVLAGAIAFAFSIIIPAIAFLMSKKTRNGDGQAWWGYLELLDRSLSENGFDSTSCLQRVVCWAVKNSAQNVKQGHSSSSDKIIDGLASSQWVLGMVEGSVVHDAVRNGLGGKNCAKVYGQCQIIQESIRKMTKFVHTINNKKK